MRTLICGGLSLALLCGTAMAQGAQPSAGDTGARTATPFVTEQDGSGATEATRPESDRDDTDRGWKDGDDDRDGKAWDDDDRKDDWRGHGDRRGSDRNHGRMRDRDDRGPHHERKGRWDERGPKHHMGPHGKGPMGGEGPHHGWMGGPGADGDDGAAHFRFDRGGRGGSIDIKCAADETTQECVDAIMPLMEAIMDARGRD